METPTSPDDGIKSKAPAFPAGTHAPRRSDEFHSVESRWYLSINSNISHFTLKGHTTMASLRSLAASTRALSRAAIRRTALPALTPIATRAYRQPTRDVMTGELIQLPDIDASAPPPVPRTPELIFQASLLKVEKNTKPKTRPPSSKLVFGHTFTDHMLTIPWSTATGWGTPEIKPCECVCTVSQAPSHL